MKKILGLAITLGLFVLVYIYMSFLTFTNSPVLISAVIALLLTYGVVSSLTSSFSVSEYKRLIEKTKHLHLFWTMMIVISVSVGVFSFLFCVNHYIEMSQVELQYNSSSTKGLVTKKWSSKRLKKMEVVDIENIEFEYQVKDVLYTKAVFHRYVTKEHYDLFKGVSDKPYPGVGTEIRVFYSKGNPSVFKLDY